MRRLLKDWRLPWDDWKLSLGGFLFGILLAPEYARLFAFIGLVLLGVLWYLEGDIRRLRRITREARNTVGTQPR